MKDNVRHFFYKANRNSKSVRKNCFWFEKDGFKYLVSYRTIVCGYSLKTGYFYKFWDDFSVTTLNQINCFIENSLTREPKVNVVTCNCMTGMNKRDWLSYPTTNINDIDNEVLNYIKPYLPDIEYVDNPYCRVDYIKRIAYN